MTDIQKELFSELQTQLTYDSLPQPIILYKTLIILSIPKILLAAPKPSVPYRYCGKVLGTRYRCSAKYDNESSAIKHCSNHPKHNTFK